MGLWADVLLGLLIVAMIVVVKLGASVSRQSSEPGHDEKERWCLMQDRCQYEVTVVES